MPKNKLLLFFLPLLFFIFPPIAKAQIVINEFSSGTTSDWIELYNISTQSANLSAYKLMDSGSNDKILSGEIASGGFVSFSFSNWLNNDGDSVRLFKEDFLVDLIGYGGNDQVCPAGSGESIGRYPDGNSTIERFSGPTRDSSNNSSTLNPCPTPTPTPTPTSTATPTPTPTPTPTKTPTPTPTKTPTSKPSPREEPIVESETPDNSQILGLREQLKTPEPEEEKTPKKKFPVFPVILIIVGAGLMGFAGYTLFKKMKSEGYNNQSEENN